MAGQRGLDFDGVDVFATGDKHLFAATDDIEVAVGILSRQVAGIQPPVADKLRSLSRLFKVATAQVRPAQPKLANFAPLAGRAAAIDQLCFDMQHRLTDAARLGQHDIFREHKVIRPGLRQSVAGAKANVAFKKALKDRGRAGRTATDDQLEPLKRRGGKAGVGLQILEHGRHPKHH